MLTTCRRCVVMLGFLWISAPAAWAAEEPALLDWPPGIAPVEALLPVDQLPDTSKPQNIPGLFTPPPVPPEKPRTLPSSEDLLQQRLPAKPYDPSLGYLPDRNPGLRQPPCPCLPLGEWWIEGSYFLSRTQNDSLPPLVTGGTSSQPGNPGTTLLYGPNRVEHPFRSGFEIDTGMWLDKCHNFGVEGSFFFLESNRQNFSAVSSGEEVLGRPFIDGATGRPATLIIAGPNVGPGSVLATSPLSFLEGDVHTRFTLFCEDAGRLDFLMGYQFIRLSDSLGISTAQPDGAGGVRTTQDQFLTDNLFNGFELGLAGEYRYENWAFGATLKTAFGATGTGWTLMALPTHQRA